MKWRTSGMAATSDTRSRTASVRRKARDLPVNVKNMRALFEK
jgi:hypothetical protein